MLVRSFAAGASLVVFALVSGCGSSDDDGSPAGGGASAGTAGASAGGASGGSSAQGGTSATGGSAGASAKGGSAGSGAGSAGKGGASAAGGAGATGGTTSSGGTTTAGGTSSKGGTSSQGGGAQAGTSSQGGGAQAGTSSQGGSGTAGSSGSSSGCVTPLTLVDTSKPGSVVGSGTAASCTEAALADAVKQGGIITFSCGGAATIAVTKELALRTDVDTTLDGNGMITLDGGKATRIFGFAGPDFQKTKTAVTLQRMHFTHAQSKGTKMFPPASPPCSQGYQDGGGGVIQIRDGVLHVIDSTFDDNHGATPGPDVAGGAIYAIGSFDVTVQGSTFSENSASNGGAIGSLFSNLTVFTSTFSKNQATGTGANYISDMCPLVDGQKEAGDGGNGGAIVMDGGETFAVVMCGNTFQGNVAGALGGAVFRTPDIGVEDTLFDRCTLDGNSADGGGALYFHHSNLTITASTLSNNSASGAGAIQADDTKLVMTNTTVAGNFAKKSPGGAISLFGNGGTLTNCTFANNHCDGAPGNSFAAHLFGGTKLTVLNTIFTGATQSDGNAPLSCQGTNDGSGDLQWPMTHSSGSNPDSACVTGITFVDPQLGALGDNGGPTATLLPAANSPAKGVGNACPATDQRGQSRKPSGCTAGAVELP